MIDTASWNRKWFIDYVDLPSSLTDLLKKLKFVASKYL